MHVFLFCLLCFFEASKSRIHKFYPVIHKIWQCKWYFWFQRIYLWNVHHLVFGKRFLITYGCETRILLRWAHWNKIRPLAALRKIF